MTESELIEKIQTFMENEARSCSMKDFWFMIHGYRLKVMSDATLYNRLKDFIECEGRSCSFDPELITPLYVYRMCGGRVSLEEIEAGLAEIRETKQIDG